MSCIGNRFALSTRFLAVLLPALLGFSLMQPGVGAAQEQEPKQIRLTEKHIQGFMASHQDMAKLYEGANLDKPDPKIDALAEAIVKKNGFANLADYDEVSLNISMIMSGIDMFSRRAISNSVLEKACPRSVCGNSGMGPSSG